MGRQPRGLAIERPHAIYLGGGDRDAANSIDGSQRPLRSQDDESEVSAHSAQPVCQLVKIKSVVAEVIEEPRRVDTLNVTAKPHIQWRLTMRLGGIATPSIVWGQPALKPRIEWSGQVDDRISGVLPTRIRLSAERSHWRHYANINAAERKARETKGAR